MIVSLAAERVAAFSFLNITNSMLATLIVDLLLVVLTLSLHFKGLKLVPGSLQNVIEFVLDGFLDFCEGIAKERARVFFTLVFTFFLFIILSNWLGLLPGFNTILVKEGSRSFPLFRSPTADLNTTLALGLISVITIQFFGFKFLGLGYLKKYFNFHGPIDFFVGLLELILEAAKIISFGFRLFGNIFAGEVLLLVAGTLIPLFSTIPVLGIELFVGFIQALVFAVLSLVFLNMSAEESH